MDKPLSVFLANVIKNGSITFEQAHTFNQLATPHLQFEAVMALKRARQIPPCSAAVSAPQPKTSFMANTRWIEIAVLGVTIPLLHTFCVRPVKIHSLEIKNSIAAFAAVQPIFFVKKPAFQPKTENEALRHFMNEPVPTKRIATYELTLGQTAPRFAEQAAADAESAALEALPITSRR